MTKGLARCQGIDLDRRAAGFTVGSQIIQTFKASAFTLPVPDLVLDKVEGGGATEVRNRKYRLKDGLQAGGFALLRQQVHLKKSIVGLSLNLD
ncbi:MAG TPA: hypothetical protein VIR01_13495 [Pyrinomonadaceae bacterium]